jgi:hypothetical protein
MIVRPTTYDRLSRGKALFFAYFLVGWGIPVCISFFSFESGNFGPVNDQTCWFQGHFYLSMITTYWLGFCWAMYAMFAADAAIKKINLCGTAFRISNLVEMMAYSVTFYLFWFYPILYMSDGYLTTSGIQGAHMVVSYALVMASTGLVNCIVWSLLTFRTSKTQAPSHPELSDLSSALILNDPKLDQSTYTDTKSSVQVCIPIPTVDRSTVLSCSLSPICERNPYL